MKTRRGIRSWGWLPALGVLALLAALLYGESLFSRFRMVSAPFGDAARLYYHWRAFGFGLLKTGVLPLWNPAVFCGVPFLAYPETAVLYPPNLVFLLLPVSAGINLSLVGHLVAGGFFQYLFLRLLKCSRPAALVAGTAFAFSGPMVLHLYAGHLSNICTMAWVPLLFLLAEKNLGSRGPVPPVLLGLAGALAVLAGHWQYLFFAVLALGFYLGMRLIQLGRAGLGGRLGRLLPAALLAAAASAVQILPAWEAGSVSIRPSLGYDWAAAFSLPPVNLLTLAFPGFLGDGMGAMYWGRYLHWEMCVFVGVSTLLLAGLGLFSRRGRIPVILAVLGAAALLLALGAHTPLHRGLYRFVPGFSLLRGSAKAAFLAVFSLSALAGLGVDRLGRILSRVRSRLGIFLVLLGAVAALLLPAAPPGWWRDLVRQELRRGRHNEFIPPGMPEWWQELAERTPPERWIEYTGALAAEPRFLEPTWNLLRVDLLRLSLVLAGFGLLLGCRGAKARWGAGALVALELMAWAWSFRGGFDFRICLWGSSLEEFFRLRAGGGRYASFDPADANRGMTAGAECLGGDQADAPLRTLRYLAAGEHGDPSRADLVVDITKPSALFALAGLRYYIAQAGSPFRFGSFRPVFTGEGKTVFSGPAFPRCLISASARALPGEAEVLSALVAPGYDPAAEVFLDKDPPGMFRAGTGSPGRVLRVEETPNRLLVEAEMAKDGILLVNDAWDRGWSARSGGTRLEVYRANYLMRAVFLPPGSHRVIFSYRPRGLPAGAVISAAAWILGLGVLLRALFRGRADRSGP